MSDEFGAVSRTALVRALRANGTVRSAAVEAAIAVVPRERFAPAGTSPRDAYADRPLVLTRGADGEPTSTISQPSMIAVMLEQLRVLPAQRVLEIGTASGYNAALLAHLTGPAGAVTTIELDADLAAAARSRLTGFEPPVLVLAGDGWHGAAAQAPFDRIVVTVGVDDIAPAWVEQLRDGGVLVAPVTLRPALELSLALVRHGAELRATSVHPCGFVRLRGPHASRGTLPLADGGMLRGALPPGSEQAVRALLATDPVDAGPAGDPPESWKASLALAAAHPLVLVTPEPEPTWRMGLHDPAGGGVAVVDGDRISAFGDAGAARLLRAHLAAAEPLRVDALRIVVHPADAPRPPGRWAVRTPHAVFGIDP